jgi:ActR/RegA family two-component response regulator
MLRNGRISSRPSATFDRAFLTAALERYGGNISRTARALGLHRQSLQKMLRRMES